MIQLDTMTDYSRGKIYKLVNNVDDKIYVGATCGTLRLRKSRHKSKSKFCPDRTVYKHFNEIGWENVNIILIEEIKCESKMELSRRERHWIDELKPDLNLVVPLRTMEEYYIDNKEIIVERSKNRYLNNKESILTKKKQYRQDNKESISIKAKEYRQDNKESISIKAKEYYQNNKGVILTRQSQKIICPCGSKYTLCHKARHFRTKKHMKYSEAV